MQKQCIQCSRTFIITAGDDDFYKRINVPVPTHCPACRQQRRLAWRNEYELYSRSCDFCHQAIISIYSADKPFPVYCANCYWSDQWNPLAYGLEYDPEKSFFAQFHLLQNKTPRLAIINRQSENSTYTNISARNKNCYMLIESSDNENCLYSYWIQQSHDLVDCSFCDQCELCYDCDNCQQCYNVQHAQNSTSCRDSMYLLNCAGLAHCVGCVNLKNKSYCFFNQQYSEAEYNKLIADLSDAELQKKFDRFLLTQPRRYSEIYASEGCSGNYITHSTHCIESFHAQAAEQCRYAHHVWRGAKECVDVDTVGMTAELIYESINTAIDVYDNAFCLRCWTVRHSSYSADCDNSHDLFGCISLHQQSYCILNKQYSESDYHRIKSTIIQTMRQAGEYGEFFPISQSPFAYNETIAQYYFPITAEKAQQAQWQWLVESRQSALMNSTTTSPICHQCQQPFKIIQPEQLFYQRQAIQLPELCFSCRLFNRLQKRNPHTLWQRACMCTQTDHGHKGLCQTQFETTYAPERKELIYCAECYAQAFN